MDELIRHLPLDLSIHVDLEVSAYPQIDYESGLRFAHEVAQLVEQHWGVKAVATYPAGWSYETHKGLRRLAMKIERGDYDHDEEAAEVAQAIVDRNRNKL